MATEKTYKQLIKDYEEVIPKLDTQKLRAFSQLKTFCSELHQNIDKLESSLKEEIDLTVLRQKSVLEEKIIQVKSKSKNKNADINDVIPEDVLITHGNVKEIFVEILLDRNVMKTIKSAGKIQVNGTEIDNSSKLEQSNVPDSLSNDVKTFDMGSTIFRPGNKFKLKREGSHVNAPAHGSFLPNGNIIFAVPFAPNGHLLVYNQSGDQLKKMELTSFPHSVAFIPPNLVCVTIQYKNCMEFRDFESLELKQTKTFPDQVSGVATIANNLVVACANLGFQIVDKDGKTLKTISAMIKEGYIDVINEIIVFAEGGTDTLFCFNSISGQKIFENEMKFGNLKGVTILRDRSILVSMFRTGKNNVTRISPDGSEQVKQIEFSSISWPSAIRYDEQSRKLFILYGADQVFIYNEK